MDVVYFDKVMKELDTRQIILQAAATRLNIVDDYHIAGKQDRPTGKNLYSAGKTTNNSIFNTMNQNLFLPYPPRAKFHFAGIVTSFPVSYLIS
jgi:hypothetical protein